MHVLWRSGRLCLTTLGCGHTLTPTNRAPGMTECDGVSGHSMSMPSGFGVSPAEVLSGFVTLLLAHIVDGILKPVWYVHVMPF